MIDQSFWANKRVFITGHTGFKGTWLTLWLMSLGAKVTGYSLKPLIKSLYVSCDLDSSMDSIIGNVRDQAHLQKAIMKANPDVIFHMAAQPIVLESYKKPVETYDTNVMGTVNLLESVRQAVEQNKGIKAVVNITTDKCYENREWLWGYRENDRLGGYDPYSNSKACSELVTASYRQSFFNPNNYHIHGVALATARAGNVIGGGDWAQYRLIPDCIRALIKNQPIKIRNKNAIRPWQHVLEPLSGYILLAEKLYVEGPQYSGSWNFGPDFNDTKSVELMVQQMCAQWGDDAKYVIEEGDHPHEASFLRLDCSKAKDVLGWKPKWHTEDAILKVVEWSKAYIDGQNVKSICLKQIESYMAHKIG